MDPIQETSPSEALAVVDAAIATAENETREQASEIIDAVVEQAAQEIDAAQEAARQMAEAAMQTEIGRRVLALEERIFTWSDALENLRLQLSELSQQMLALSAAPEPTIVVSSPSIPPNSQEAPEVLAIVQEPQTLQNVAEENPEPAPPARKARRWM